MLNYALEWLAANKVEEVRPASQSEESDGAEDGQACDLHAELNYAEK